MAWNKILYIPMNIPLYNTGPNMQFTYVNTPLYDTRPIIQSILCEYFLI